MKGTGKELPDLITLEVWLGSILQHVTRGG